MRIEHELQDIDFSKLSKVKNSLKAHLHELRDKKRELSWDELDNLAAAGGPTSCQPPDLHKNK